MNDTRYTAIAAALREEFPKANKGTVSMALHTNDYGVSSAPERRRFTTPLRNRSPADRTASSPYGYSAG